jgi:hypothetical protein
MEGKLQNMLKKPIIGIEYLEKMMTTHMLGAL